MSGKELINSELLSAREKYWICEQKLKSIQEKVTFLCTITYMKKIHVMLVILFSLRRTSSKIRNFSNFLPANKFVEIQKDFLSFWFGRNNIENETITPPPLKYQKIFTNCFFSFKFSQKQNMKKSKHAEEALQIINISKSIVSVISTPQIITT